MFGFRDVIVFDEHDVEFFFERGIFRYVLGKRVYERDYALCVVIAARRFCSEDKRLRSKISAGIVGKVDIVADDFKYV